MLNIDEYIAAYDGEIKERMVALRSLIHDCHPDITEKIAWGIPTFVLEGNLIHFSAEKKHTGFHPGKEAIDAFFHGVLLAALFAKDAAVIAADSLFQPRKNCAIIEVSHIQEVSA